VGIISRCLFLRRVSSAGGVGGGCGGGDGDVCGITTQSDGVVAE